MTAFTALAAPLLVANLLLGLLPVLLLPLDSPGWVDFSVTMVLGGFFWRQLSQEAIRVALEKDSPRFRALPPVMRRHCATLVTKVFDFVLLGPLMLAGPSFAVRRTSQQLVDDLFPAYRAAMLLYALVSMVDLNQRRKPLASLYGHHAILAAVVALVSDAYGETFREPGNIAFGVLGLFDMPIWVVWVLYIMRRQRDQEKVPADADERFPPPSWYLDPRYLAWMNRAALFVFVVLARGGCAAVLVLFLRRNWAETPLFWKVTRHVRVALARRRSDGEGDVAPLVCSRRRRREAVSRH